MKPGQLIILLSWTEAGQHVYESVFVSIDYLVLKRKQKNTDLKNTSMNWCMILFYIFNMICILRFFYADGMYNFSDGDFQ